MRRLLWLLLVGFRRHLDNGPSSGLVDSGRCLVLEDGEIGVGQGERGGRARYMFWRLWEWQGGGHGRWLCVCGANLGVYLGLGLGLSLESLVSWAGMKVLSGLALISDELFSSTEE